MSLCLNPLNQYWPFVLFYPGCPFLDSPIPLCMPILKLEFCRNVHGRDQR